MSQDESFKDWAMANGLPYRELDEYQARAKPVKLFSDLPPIPRWFHRVKLYLAITAESKVLDSVLACLFGASLVLVASALVISVFL
jgi:hypothetical protein